MPTSTDTLQPTSPLAQHVIESINRYLHEMDGFQATNLHHLVLNEVEAALLQVVLNQTQGNQTHAATMLGVSRNTLRKKMTQHGLL